MQVTQLWEITPHPPPHVSIKSTVSRASGIHQVLSKDVCVLLKMVHRAMLGKCSTPELHLQPLPSF